MKLEKFGESWKYSDYGVTLGPAELIFNETGACLSFRGKRVAGLDVGDIGKSGWAISLDIGPLSVILGDLAGRYGLRVAWYRGGWAYTLEVSNHPKIERAKA
jgi:hypothetical protein